MDRPLWQLDGVSDGLLPLNALNKRVDASEFKFEVTKSGNRLFLLCRSEQSLGCL
jgi:hypothetical protein